MRLLRELPQAPETEVRGMLENKTLSRVHLLSSQHCTRSFGQVSKKPRGTVRVHRECTHTGESQKEETTLDSDDTCLGVLRKEKFLWAG